MATNEKKRAAVSGQAGAGAAGGKRAGGEPSARRSGAAGGKPGTAQSAKSKSAAKGGAGGKRAGSGGGKRAGAKPRVKSAIGSTRVKDRSGLSERMAKKTRTRLFLESSVLDFLLVLLVSASLSFTVSYAFHSAWDYRGNVAMVAALMLPTLLCLYAGSWSKRAVLPAGIACAVVGVVMVAVAVGISPDPFIVDGSLSDTEGCYGIFAIVCFVVPVVVFLLSRRPVGMVFLLLAATIAAGLVQFLYREWAAEGPGIPAAVVMLFGIGMMFVYECYKQSVYSANRVKRTSFAGAFAFSALIGAVCVLVGAGVFYGVVAATDLETPEIKLFEEYVSPPVTDEARDYEKMEIRGNETSDNTGDETDDTGEIGPGDESNVESGTATLPDSVLGKLVSSIAGVDPDEVDSSSDNAAMHFAMQLLWIIYVVLAVAAVVAFLAFWRYRRTLRLKRIAKRSNAYQVYYLYEFLLERFRRMRIRKPAYLTPVEFAEGFARTMHPYTRGANGVDFIEVTNLYQEAVFGGREPSDEELERVRGYYRAFYKNAFKATMWPKWIFWRFWRL